jgi:hypothetical protein
MYLSIPEGGLWRILECELTRDEEEFLSLYAVHDRYFQYSEDIMDLQDMLEFVEIGILAKEGARDKEYPTTITESHVAVGIRHFDGLHSRIEY